MYALALMERTPDLELSQPARFAPQGGTNSRLTAARRQAARVASSVRVIHGFVITSASEL